MKPHSKDLRLKVLAAVDPGMPRMEVARVFGVPVPMIKRYLRLRRETKDVEPKTVPGPEARKGAALEAVLAGQVRTNPDATLEEHREAFEEDTRVRVSTASVSRALKRLGLPLKKVPPRLRVRRGRAVALARAGRAAGAPPPGVRGRVRDAHLHDAPPGAGTARRAGLRQGAEGNRAKNTTQLASMSVEGMGPCVAVVGTTTKAVFEAYVEQILAPALRPGQVVVLDNPAAHKGERVRELVEGRGCSLVFLPSYSTDLSPIEEAFSKLKALLRRAAACTCGALVEAIGRALDAITGRDAQGWFAHCGYVLGAQLS